MVELTLRHSQPRARAWPQRAARALARSLGRWWRQAQAYHELGRLGVRERRDAGFSEADVRAAEPMRPWGGPLPPPI